MLFKPNFCCNCGTKIERAEWTVMTSRRFCPVCAEENKGADWFPRIIVLAGFLAGVFGLGAYVGGSGQHQPVALKTAENEPARKITVGAKPQPGIKNEEKPPVQPETAVALPEEGSTGSDAVKSRPGTATIEQAYYCGAMTKKGTPCSRRVKSKGRCWQHKGQPSALVSQSTPDVY